MVPLYFSGELLAVGFCASLVGCLLGGATVACVLRRRFKRHLVATSLYEGPVMSAEVH